MVRELVRARELVRERALVLVRVRACGICGSDLSTVTYSLSPALEPFSSFPAVLGHEVLARVAEVGSDVDRVRIGQRVNVDPTLSCTVRGHPESCPAWVLYTPTSGRRSECYVVCRRYPLRRRTVPRWWL